MIFRKGFFGFLLGMVFFGAISFPAPVHGEDRFHTVQRGETFFSISRAYGLRADDLMRLNGITDPSRLQAGQRLRIPPAAGQSPGQNNAPGGENFTTYRVLRGDTFFSLSRRFSVTESAIRQANNLSDAYILREGDTLRIPAVASAPATPAATAAGANATTANGNASATPVPPAPIPSLNASEVSMVRSVSAGRVNSEVLWPVNAQEISHMTGKLSGVIITGERSEPVLSLTRGTVISVGPYRGFGRVAIVQVEGGYLYVYGGAETLSVKEGDRVNPGTEIGRLGIDAVSNRPQLFFMVYRGNNPIDPAAAPRA